mgnify:CR=1 FL=1
MKFSIIFLILSAFIFFNTVTATPIYFPVGARSVGMGNAAVTISDPWATFNNIAGLASLTNSGVAFFYEKRYNFSAFNLLGSAVCLPTKYGVPGLGLFRFGDALYNESRINFGWAHKINKVSLGIQADYLQIYIAEFGAKNNLALNFGGQVEIIKQLIFGATVYNLNQASISSYQDERIPTIMKAGLGYKPHRRLMLNLEIEKNVLKPSLVKIGLEYCIIDNIAARTGINTNTDNIFFGFGYKNKVLHLDYAVSIHHALGFSSAFSLGFIFPKAIYNRISRK